jgi:hypothetical protein
LKLSDHLKATFQVHFALRRWHDRCLLAVDGSTIRLPATPDVIAASRTSSVRQNNVNLSMECAQHIFLALF